MTEEQQELYDIAGRNWRDELFYQARDYMELKGE